MLNKMIEKVAEKLMAHCERKGKVLKISGTAGPDDVYLIRYYVVKSKYFNLFIHQFLRSDRDDLHDHPWDFCTYLVRGAYTEKKYNQKTGEVESIRRTDGSFCQSCSVDHELAKNRLVFRKATDQHQVVVDRDLKEADKDKAALTIFMSGPTKREWGFVKVLADGIACNGEEIKPNTRKWVPWREYLGLPPNTPGRG